MNSSVVCWIFEIETLGNEGLRYRVRAGVKGSSRWKAMEAYPVSELRDAAGAGYWCTAGILHALGGKGAKGASGLIEIIEEEIEEALRLGQAFAAVKCGYEGARGAMYVMTRRELEAAVTGILKGDTPSCIEEEIDDNEPGDLLRAICPGCDSKD